MKKKLFKDKYIGYHTFGLGVDNTSVESTDDLITNGYEYVDLGLPSGTLWAKCNVGAETETDYGLYFAWGETQGYTADQVGTDKNFIWGDYKFNPTGDGTTFTKYNLTDGKDTLDLEDDAARVNMGGMWRMPSNEQIKELLTYTTYTVVASDPEGIIGMLFTSIRNGNTLFIPYAGFGTRGEISLASIVGCLWSSLRSIKGIDGAFLLRSYENSNIALDAARSNGYPVRGVLNKL